jgi:hypothetical protein
VTEIGRLIASLMTDAATSESLGQVLAEADPALRALVAGLIGQGRHADAHRICLLRLAETPEAGAWHLLSSRAMAGMGHLEEAIRILVALRATGAPCERLYEEMLDLAVIATQGYEDCMVAGDFERAGVLCEHLMAMCPGVEPFERGRQEARYALRRKQAEMALLRDHAVQAERLTWQHIDRLEEEAVACNARLDFTAELRNRLEVIRHPLDPQRHSAWRMKNFAGALACLLMADVESFPPVRLELIRDLLQRVAAMPPGHPDATAWSDDALGWWGRHQQTLLGTIELDRIFGAPAPASPPLPISFLSSAGAPMEIEAVAARGRALSARLVFFTSASAEYFARYARIYVSTVLAACDCACLVVVCVCAPRRVLAEHVASLGIDDPRLVFCSDDFDPAANPFIIYSPNHYEPLSVNAAYYASAALLRAETLLTELHLPVVVTGVDTVLHRGVVDMLERFGDADIVLNRLRSNALLGSQFVNNLVLLYPTEGGLLFARFLKDYMAPHLAAPVQSIFQDQLDLHMAKHHLIAFGRNPVVRHFDERDINNAIFTRANYRAYEERMRGYRFLNMFVSAFQDDALTAEDVVPASIAA